MKRMCAATMQRDNTQAFGDARFVSLHRPEDFVGGRRALTRSAPRVGHWHRDLKNNWHIIAVPIIIPRTYYDRLRTWVMNTRDYGVLTDELKECLQTSYPGVDLRYIINLRQTLLKEKVISSYPRMQRMISRLRAAYSRRDIHHIAHDYDFAPLNMLRSIFMQTYSEDVVRSVFNGGPLDRLTRRDQKQFKLASAHDSESTITATEVLTRALDAENKFVESLLHIAHKTQDTLAEEQKEKYGRAINTPDILFLEPVFINGQRVNWIDYKDYVGCDVSFLINSNRKQCARYVAEWGPGALVYWAHVEGLHIDQVQLLSRETMVVDQ